MVLLHLEIKYDFCRQSPAIHEKRHFMIERVIQITDIMDDSGLDGPSGTGVQVLLKLN